jgi:hypothetical protein
MAVSCDGASLAWAIHGPTSVRQESALRVTYGLQRLTSSCVLAVGACALRDILQGEPAQKGVQACAPCSGPPLRGTLPALRPRRSRALDALQADALDALGSHRKAVVLVGAQAIYQRIGEGELLVAPFTSDGDLALNPSVLDDEPILAEALQVAGFALAVKPGTWAREEVQIDRLVPSSLGGAGRRSARFGPHGTEVARKAKGLEAAFIDNSVVTLTALDPADTRTIEVAVAGLGALLVAKLHKLAERETEPGRWSPKDGLDVLRILQSAELAGLGATLAGLERHTLAGPISVRAARRAASIRPARSASSGDSPSRAVSVFRKQISWSQGPWPRLPSSSSSSSNPSSSSPFATCQRG